MSVTTITGATNALAALSYSAANEGSAVVVNVLTNLLTQYQNSIVLDTSNGVDTPNPPPPFIYNPDVTTAGQSATIKTGTSAFILAVDPNAVGETINNSISNVLIAANNVQDTVNVTGGSGVTVVGGTVGQIINLGGSSVVEVDTGNGKDTVSLSGSTVSLNGQMQGTGAVGSGEQINFTGGVNSVTQNDYTNPTGMVISVTGGTNTFNQNGQGDTQSVYMSGTSSLSLVQSGAMGDAARVSITGGNDTLSLSSGANTVNVSGANATVSITNTSGSMVFNDTAANSAQVTVAAGTGADVFNFSTQAGGASQSYTITGFQSGDTVHVTGYAASQVTYNGSDTIIHLGTNATVTIKNYNATGSVGS